MSKSFIALLLAGVMALQAFAIPAHRGFVPMPQPDGTTVSIGLVGDEFYHYNITEDGYTVIFNEQGAYVYAQLEEGALKPGTILAHNQGERNAAELALLDEKRKSLDELKAIIANRLKEIEQGCHSRGRCPPRQAQRGPVEL